MSIGLNQLYKLMKGNGIKYLGAIVTVGLATMVSMFPPLVVRFTVDSVIGNSPFDVPDFLEKIVGNVGGREFLSKNIFLCAMFIVFAALLNGFFSYLKGRWSAEASETVALQLKDRLYNHLQKLPYGYHVKAQTGDLIQRCTSDVETIRRFLANQLVEVGRCVFIIAMAASIMFSINVKMAFISLAVVPFVFVCTVVFFKRIHKIFSKVDAKEGELSAVLQENLSGVRVVRAFGRQAYEVEKFEEKSSQFKELVQQLIHSMSWFWSISDFLCISQMALILFVGVYWAVQGELTIGTLIIFNSYVGMLLWPIRSLGRVLTDMGKTFVSVTRVYEILNEPVEDMNENGLTPDLRGVIEFKNVSFEYEKGRPVLNNLSFKVNKGETIAILGQTGSGKSSIMHILLRLYDYKHGSVKINGAELNKINKEWLRTHVGIVLQEPFLYSKTIKENLKMAKFEATDNEINEATSIAYVHDVIEGFDKGYNTIVGEKGVTLSGGQKQRVAIARTLIKNSSILIFDDSLSAVDAETDASIRSALKERSKDVTTFIISQRITTLAEADRIFVLENGTLADIGNHSDLIARPGLYKRIWDIQSMLEDEFDIDENVIEKE